MNASDTPSPLVVVGAGLGGLRVVESLRQHGYTEPIVLVGGENHLPYDRPPLTKQVLRGERSDTSLREEFESLDVEVRLGQRAERLDLDDRRIELADGESIAFSSAVLAPGAIPRRLPNAAARPGLHVVRTIEDSLELHRAIKRSGAVTVIGGGFVGCEVAASARTMDVDVTLIEALPAPLIRVVGALAAQEIQALHTERGVTVLTDTMVDEVIGSDHVEALMLSGERRLSTSEVVLGLGVIPDLDWLTGSGLEIQDGIVCTAGGLTSAPGVYAVGDAARWWHPLAGAHRRIEHWTSTADQAGVVAANIVARAGGEDADTATLNEVPYFWSDQYEIKIQALGFIEPDADCEHLTANGRSVYIYSRDGGLTGVLGLSAGRSVMRLRSLIAGRASRDEALALLAG